MDSSLPFESSQTLKFLFPGVNEHEECAISSLHQNHGQTILDDNVQEGKCGNNDDS